MKQLTAEDFCTAVELGPAWALTPTETAEVNGCKAKLTGCHMRLPADFLCPESRPGGELSQRNLVRIAAGKVQKTQKNSKSDIKTTTNPARQPAGSTPTQP